MHAKNMQCEQSSMEHPRLAMAPKHVMEGVVILMRMSFHMARCLFFLFFMVQ